MGKRLTQEGKQKIHKELKYNQKQLEIKENGNETNENLKKKLKQNQSHDSWG